MRINKYNYKALLMRSRLGSDNFTEGSTGLKPIYAKVQELIKLKHLQNQQQKKKIISKIIEPVPKIQLKMQIDRSQQYKKKRHSAILNVQQHILKPSTYLNSTTRVNLQSLKLKSKSQKILNFLRANQAPNLAKRQSSPVFVDRLQNDRQVFTPMRPISRISRGTQSVAGTQKTKKSGSHQNKSSGGYSQIARLSGSSKNSSTPSKYLRKGHRLRQVLGKQLQVAENIEQQKELVYLKEYDQWIPAQLVSFKKLELDHFMNILMGNKRKNAKKQQDLKFEPIYL